MAVVVSRPADLKVSAGESLTLTASGVTVGNDATTDEVPLQSYVLPARTLTKDQAAIRILAFGVFANNAHAKAAHVYFGSTEFNLAADVSADETWAFEMLVVGSDAAQSIRGSGTITKSADKTVAQANAVTAATENGTSPITIQVTGQTDTADSANDVTCQGFLVEYLTVPQ